MRSALAGPHKGANDGMGECAGTPWRQWVSFSGFGVASEGAVNAVIRAAGAFCLKVKGRTCREHTRRVSIPAERNNAQKSRTPRSRDPVSVVDARMKSALETSSVPSGVDHCGTHKPQPSARRQRTEYLFRASASIHCVAVRSRRVIVNFFRNAVAASFRPSINIFDLRNCWSAGSWCSLA